MPLFKKIIAVFVLFHVLSLQVHPHAIMVFLRPTIKVFLCLSMPTTNCEKDVYVEKVPGSERGFEHLTNARI